MLAWFGRKELSPAPEPELSRKYPPELDGFLRYKRHLEQVSAFEAAVRVWRRAERGGWKNFDEAEFERCLAEVRKVMDPGYQPLINGKVICREKR